MSCTTRQAPSSTSPPSGSQADAETKARKQQEAAEAKAKKEKEAADAKAAKDAAEKARKEKAAQDAEQKAKARHDQEMALAAAKAKKEKDAADAKAMKKAQADAARQAKIQKPGGSMPPSAGASTMTNSAAAPAANPNEPPTKDQQLGDLMRRYQHDEISPRQYQIERAKILAGP